MNHNYYDNPIYSDNRSDINMYQNNNYLDIIMSKNRGKRARLFVSFPGSSEWQDKLFEGIIENVSRDSIVISNSSNGEWIIIPIIYLDYITMEGPIIY